MKLFFIIVWVVYASIDGIRNGFYYHNRRHSNRQDDSEIQPLFFLQYTFILMIFFVPIDINEGLKKSLLFVLGQAMIFSFFYSYGYYSTRNNLDKNICTKRWRDNPTSTLSEPMGLNFITRVLLLISGSAILYLNY